MVRYEPASRRHQRVDQDRQDPPSADLSLAIDPSFGSRCVPMIRNVTKHQQIPHLQSGCFSERVSICQQGAFACSTLILSELRATAIHTAVTSALANPIPKPVYLTKSVKLMIRIGLAPNSKLNDRIS